MRVLREEGEGGRWRGRRVGIVSATDYWPRFARGLLQYLTLEARRAGLVGRPG